MTTVVVGGGPTGVVLAGALAELQRHVLRRDFPRLDISHARVVLLEATDRVLPTLPDSLRRKAERQMRDLGVEVRTGAAVASADEGGVTLKDGGRIDSGTVVWVAGVRASPLAAELGGGGPAGRVAVRPTLQTVARDDVYVVGDMAFVTEQGGHPAIAPVAIAQGETAAKNILRAIAGEAQRPLDFEARDMLVTIGRSRGVAVVRGLRFSGLVAWLLWLFVHLLKLVGLRNRLVVLTNWVWNYFTYDRGVRIITGRTYERDGRDAWPPSV
jgi:NADH dehydrogenase